MAAQFYVTIQGRQGVFLGEGTRHGNKIAGLALKYGVTSPHDPATGQTSGRSQHEPVTFVKEWGAASPQLYSAVVNNELLTSVVFEFVKTNPNGEEYVYQTIKLTNATVMHISLNVDAPTPGAPGDTRELEEVSFAFQTIELSNIGTQGAVQDSWHVGSSVSPSPGGAEGVSKFAPLSRVQAGGPSLMEDKERVALTTPLLLRGR